MKEKDKEDSCTPVPYTNKTDRNYVTAILLKVALSAITYTPNGVVTTINGTYSLLYVTLF
jgi:uncharacterized protein YqgV (UPF0045/DUF77 family)